MTVRSSHSASHITLSLVCAVLCVAQLTFAGTLAQFRTALGTIDVELFDDAKPVTVQNFLRYVRSEAYTNMFFHRWVPGFVVQGGGFTVVRRSNTNAFEPIPSYGNITNEFNVGSRWSNTYGTLAMARVSGQTNSATSQWFFNLANNSGLDSVDGGFTVFGRVVGGTNVLNRFNNVAATNGIYRISAGGALNELPVLSPNPTFQDLLYVDISLLNVLVARSENGHEISWNSVSNRVNRVEFTSVIPPVWQLLVSTNGTGGPLRVKDSAKDPKARFYRVRVEY
jgi:cyclophilin family peptidyl-prolyl cis-trans isomerase